MPSICERQQQMRMAVRCHAKPNNGTALIQILMTLVPLALLWLAAVQGARISYWLTAAATPLISLFTLRVFALMHDCGHGSLFRTQRLNRAFGFLFGVISGMPQYVWSQHHNFHHTNNGNWDKYRGPLTTLSVGEYAAMSAGQQRRYRQIRTVGAAPVGGFIYLIFNPRFTWIKGSLQLALHVLKGLVARPRVAIAASIASFETRYWQSREEYRHMAWNNLALLSIWVLMSWACGPALFFIVYVASVSLAGGAGIVLFTVQHNFEHAYASDTARWDYYTGAIEGSSFLILPRWLNWFTVDIAYHHIHHLSASIPNYCLVKCHNENRELFQDVTRIRLSKVLDAAKCILWDTHAQRIISVAEYRSQQA